MSSTTGNARSRVREIAAGVRRVRRAPAVSVWLWSVVILAGATGAIACGEAPPRPTIRLDHAAPEVAQAVRAAESRVIARPRAAANWLSLGMVCEANGLTTDARWAYEQATAIDDRNPRTWYRLAMTRSRAGDLHGALAALDTVIALDDQYAPAHWRRGLWLLDTGRESEAHGAFERATIIDPASPGGWVGLARAALHRQDTRRAVEVLERFLSAHPGDRYALRLLGTAYQRLGRTDEAAHALSAGATGEPSWPDPWSDELAQHRVGFAQTLKAATQGVLAGDFARAIPLFEKLLNERPDDLSLMQQLGLSYVAVGRTAEGIALLQRALARDQNNLETHLRLASAYINTGNPPQALVHANRAVDLSPELGRAYEARGMALWRSGQPVDALAAFEQMIRYDPGNMNAQIWIGSILLDAGRDREALARFERALQTDPTLADGYVGLALVHLRQRRLDIAEEALTRAVALERGNPRVRAAIARLERLKRESPR